MMREHSTVDITSIAQAPLRQYVRECYQRRAAVVNGRVTATFTKATEFAASMAPRRGFIIPSTACKRIDASRLIGRVLHAIDLGACIACNVTCLTSISCVAIGAIHDFNAITAMVHSIDGDTMRVTMKSRRTKRFAHIVTRQRDNESTNDMRKRLAKFKRRATSSAPAAAADDNATTIATTATTAAADTTTATVTSAVSATLGAAESVTTSATSATAVPVIGAKRVRDDDDDDDVINQAPSPSLPLPVDVDPRSLEYRNWIRENARKKKYDV